LSLLKFACLDCAQNSQYASKYRSTLCLGLSYFYSLLVDGYGFVPGSTDAVFQVRQQLGSFDLGWALGGMLYQANNLAWALPPVPECDGLSRDDSIVMGSVLSGLLLVVSLGFFVTYARYSSLRADVSRGDRLVDNEAAAPRS
jgi:hypothetical protein